MLIEYIGDTASHPVRFRRLYAISALVISSAIAWGITGNSFHNVPLAAGCWIDGQFSSFTFARSVVVAYQGNRGESSSPCRSH